MEVVFITASRMLGFLRYSERAGYDTSPFERGGVGRWVGLRDEDPSLIYPTEGSIQTTLYNEIVAIRL